MKAKQAIDLLENGIMPCILTSSITSVNEEVNFSSFTIDYIYKYSLSSSAYSRGSSSPSYQFITLNGDYLFANNLDEEISINNNNSGGGIIFA